MSARWEGLGELGRAMARLAAALREGRLEAAREAMAAADAAWPLTPERLDHLSRLMDLGEVAAELAHELRQPLLGIKAFAQMTAEAPDDAARAAQRSEAIVTQSRRMEQLLDRTSAYARGRRPAGGGEAPPTSLDEAVQAAVELLGPRLRAEGVRLQVAQDAATPVAADPVALQQVVVNLVNNAREALDGRGGTIRLTTDRQDGHVRLRVRDDGPGVPEALRERLFEPFATSKPKGSGLGLHICRRIVTTAGGSVTYRPLDPGSEFTVVLPRRL